MVITIAPRQCVLSTRGFLSTLIAAGLDFLSFFSFFFISCIYYLLIINVELLVEFFFLWVFTFRGIGGGGGGGVVVDY